MLPASDADLSVKHGSTSSIAESALMIMISLVGDRMSYASTATTEFTAAVVIMSD